jgi:hypothetical protein
MFPRRVRNTTLLLLRAMGTIEKESNGGSLWDQGFTRS